MGKKMKSLAKDTAIYGMSSIIGRFLNWLLVPLYVRLFTEADNGVITNVYAYVAFIFVILTYGMETTFFRYVNKKEEDSATVYSTSLISLFFSSTFFIVLCYIFISPISSFMGYEQHPDYILLMAFTVAIDAFCIVPFAYLRYKERPFFFASLKLFSIAIIIGMNLFFLLLCPRIYENNPDLISWFYDPDYGIGYIFVSNLIATVVTLLLLTSTFRGFKFRFDRALLMRMLRYSMPLLILGIAGVINQTFDKMIFPYLFDDRQAAAAQLGIYGSCAKIAVVMAMATQAFRYAYEPFIFAQSKEKNSKAYYALAMKFFVIFGFLIFLGIMFYMDILKHFVIESYYEGLKVIPLLLFAEICFGIYFNLSLWYKLTDKTFFGAIFASIGCFIIITGNIIFIPIYGYMACAWVSLLCNLVMVLLSYFFGQKHYPIKYDLKNIAIYFILALVLFLIGMSINMEPLALKLFLRTLLLVVFIVFIIKRDLPLLQIPVINRIIKRK